jgi:RNA polymerase sigma factor for flagellar operon FliA
MQSHEPRSQNGFRGNRKRHIAPRNALTSNFGLASLTTMALRNVAVNLLNPVPTAVGERTAKKSRRKSLPQLSPTRQAVSPPSRASLTTPPDISSAECELPGHPSARLLAPRQDLLTPEQELVMTEHLPMVQFIARRIHERLPQHVPVDDLYSAGVLGLLDAFARFDPSKQVQFSTYAQFRVRGAILDSLRTVDWSPRALRRKGRAVEQAIQTLTAQFHRSPTEIEIAHQLHIDLPAYRQLLGELSGLEIGTLYSGRSEDSGEEELVYMPSRPEDDPLFCYLGAEMRQRLTEAITDLPERERLVMTLYYYEETTMKEIGLILGVVESRVSQIHASAVLHLRSRLLRSNRSNSHQACQVKGKPL